MLQCNKVQERMSEHPFVFVTGLPLSGKSFVCGVLHHLGVPMAADYLDCSDKDFDWYEDKMVRGEIGFPTRLTTRNELERYIQYRKEQHPDGPVGVKWTNPRVLVEEGIPDNSYVFLCLRSLFEVYKRYEDPALAVYMYGWLRLLGGRDVDISFMYGWDIIGNRRMSVVSRIASLLELPVTQEVLDFAERRV